MSFDPPLPLRSLRTPAVVAQAAFAFASVTVLVVTPLALRGTVELAAVDAHAISWVALQLVAGIVLFAVNTFAAVAFIVFLHRARTNLGPGLRWGPGWTIGGWFIPLAHLVIPLLVVREIDRHSRVPGRAPFRVWATCWTLYLLLSQANAVRDAARPDLMIEPTAGGIAAELVAAGLYAAAGAAGIVMIRRIATAQEHLARWAPVPTGPPVDLPGHGR